mmetsp:Transcript_31596/g.68316  ORF Transcript_31596/g.68316 Transcript_31596/m.68316 type:complete len:298 (+) Transcript_31596:509-1402(+)
MLVVENQAVSHAPVLEERSDLRKVLWKLLVLVQEDALLALSPLVALPLRLHGLFSVLRGHQAVLRVELPPAPLVAVQQDHVRNANQSLHLLSSLQPVDDPHLLILGANAKRAPVRIVAPAAVMRVVPALEKVPLLAAERPTAKSAPKPPIRGASKGTLSTAQVSIARLCAPHAHGLALLPHLELPAPLLAVLQVLESQVEVSCQHVLPLVLEIRGHGIRASHVRFLVPGHHGSRVRIEVQVRLGRLLKQLQGVLLQLLLVLRRHGTRSRFRFRFGLPLVLLLPAGAAGASLFLLLRV